MVSIAGVYGLVSAGLLSGEPGPTGPEGPQGFNEPIETLSVERCEWTLTPGELRQATVYLQEDNVLEGSVVADGRDCYFFMVNLDEEIIQWYPSSPNLEFSHVADMTGFFNLRVHNYGTATTKFVLTYWVNQ